MTKNYMPPHVNRDKLTSLCSPWSHLVFRGVMSTPGDCPVWPTCVLWLEERFFLRMPCDVCLSLYLFRSWESSSLSAKISNGRRILFWHDYEAIVLLLFICHPHLLERDENGAWNWRSSGNFLKIVRSVFSLSHWMCCAVFKAAGIDLSKPTIMSCGSGVTACTLAFSAFLTGKEVPVFDVSTAVCNWFMLPLHYLCFPKWRFISLLPDFYSCGKEGRRGLDIRTEKQGMTSWYWHMKVQLESGSVLLLAVISVVQLISN